MLGIGGYNFFSFTYCQSMPSKNGYLFISSEPSGPAPSLLLGFLFNNYTIRFLQSSDKLAGIFNTPL